jgi:hypothetical protein
MIPNQATYNVFLMSSTAHQTEELKGGPFYRLCEYDYQYLMQANSIDES